MSASSSTGGNNGAANNTSSTTSATTSTSSTLSALVLDDLGSTNSGDLLEAVRSLTPNDVRALVVQLNGTLQGGERGASCGQQLASLYRVVRLNIRQFDFN
jgi:hypothetical protein